MNAKKLTLAVSFMMVLAAAFVLVVPSESDDAAAFEITDVKFGTSSSGYTVKVTYSEAISTGSMTLSLNGEVVAYAEANAGTYVKTKIGTTLAEGTYDVVVKSDKGTATAQATWPAVVSHDIIVTQSVGGHVETDVSSAVPKTIVNITATPDEGYSLKQIVVNGQILAKGVFSFEMPDSTVSVAAVFEKQQCTVTFVVAEGFSKEVTATVGAPMQAPAAPEIIGAEFEGWYTEDGVKFDFETEIEGDMTLYAHFGPETPSTEQTKKFVASIAVEEDACNLVTTAYDGKIIGKGTATIGVYMMYGGNFVYIDAVNYAIDGKDVFSVDNITKEIKTIATEPGQYAVMSTIMLDSGASYITNFALFEIEAQA